MPGPGQGKRAQKKKWRENAHNLNKNLAAVNAVMTAPSATVPNTTTAALPTLLTIPEIGRFCNPATTKSTAIVHNDILRTVILELIENAKVRAFDEGKKEGYEEGYEEGKYLAGEDEQNNVFETLRREDEEQARNVIFEEGKTYGRLEERTSWMLSHGEGLCASPEVSTPRI